MNLKNTENLKTIPPQPEQDEGVAAIPKKIEREKTVEKKETEQTVEQKPQSTESGTKIKKRPPLIKKKPVVVPTARDELSIKIENILEEGLGESYSRLSPIAKQEFKIKGEQTAIKIRDLLKSTHIKVKKVLKLILEWLRVLPGVNRFFLEQEAKIKADRIIALKK